MMNPCFINRSPAYKDSYHTEASVEFDHFFIKVYVDIAQSVFDLKF